MKKLLLTLLLLCNTAFAQKLNVVVPFQTGTTPDTQCRHIFEMYDKLYNTNSSILNMPGADQLIGYKHFTSMTEPGFFCSGNGVIMAQKLNPNFNLASDLVKPVSIPTTYSYFVYATNGNSFDELMKESKKNGKKLLVGAISTHSAKLLTVILDDNKVPYEVVAFRKPTDSLPVLKDKQLDIYLDGGTMKSILDEMKEVKEIAHISVKTVSQTENLYKRNENIKYLIVHSMVYVRNNVSDSEIYELNKRFNDIMKRQETVDFMKNRFPFHIINQYTVKDIELYTTKLKQYMNNVYN